MLNRTQYGGPSAVTVFVLTMWIMSVAAGSNAESPDAIRKDGRLRFIAPSAEPLAAIDIEIADTPAARSKGLMDRRFLDDTMGMLFVYDRAAPRAFWMRRTYIPLDMVFVSADRRIVHIARQTAPLSDTHYHSKQPARYVVEVLAGFCDRHGISEGVVIEWQR